MSIFDNYKRYIKDNPNGYWFKAKPYGWGWMPVTKEGFALTLGLVLLVLLLAFQIDEASTTKEVLLHFALPTIVLLSLYIMIASKKGEKPYWKWGFYEKDESDD